MPASFTLRKEVSPNFIISSKAGEGPTHFRSPGRKELQASIGSFDVFRSASFCSKTDSDSLGTRNPLTYSSTKEYPAASNILLLVIVVDIPIFSRNFPASEIILKVLNGLKQIVVPDMAESLRKSRLDDFINYKENYFGFVSYL
jgi:hypothetical protein